MIKQLKQLLHSLACQQPAHRRAKMPQFSVRIEQLEARTVLSAATGAEPVDIEALASSAWESGATALDWRPPLREYAIGSAYGKVAEKDGANGYREPLERFDRPIRDHDFAGVLTLKQERPVYVVTILTIHVTPKSWPLGGFQPPSSPADLPPSSIPKPIAATSPNGNAVQEPAWEPPLAAHAPVQRVLPPVALFVVLSGSTSGPVAAPGLTVGAYDAAIQGYSNESLLLAASLENAGESDADGLGNIAASEELEEEEIDSEAATDEMAEKVPAPLGELERELAAIDAVLAELHEFEPRAERPADDARPKPGQTQSSVPSGEPELLWTAPRGAPLLPVASAEGGMVLLVAEGDANVGGQDLTTLYARELDESAELPLELEAAVGIYQALDIGGSQATPPASAAEIVAPTATATVPNATAESAPARQSVRSS